MQLKIKFLLFCYFWSVFVFGQNISFTFKNYPFKNQKGQVLKFGSAGGLNAPQIYALDLDFDNKEDLVIFDRSTHRFMTFLAKNNQYEYAPQFEKAFPICRGWIVLVDVDNDGLKDIFTNNLYLGVKIWKQKKNNNQLYFEPFLEEVKTEIHSKLYTLNVPLTDIPAIIDIDNDGDLDILTFEYWQGKNIELHENITPKNTKNQLLLKQKTACWANLNEGLECGDFYFENCEKSTQKGGGEPNYLLHTGSTIHLFDVNGDKKLDILIGDAACQALYVFLNEGSNKNPKFKKSNTNFPSDKPINTFNFPAVFFLDVDFDSKIDMLVAPNLFISNNNKVDFSQSLHFYKNIGSNQKPDYRFIQSNFLQDEMIDIGENASVRFEKDSCIIERRNKNELIEAENFITQKLVQDFDNDGEIDTLLVNKKGFITYKNTMIINNLGINPMIFTKDINQDNKLDICVGTSGGGVQVYENTSQSWHLLIEIKENKKYIEVKSKIAGKLLLKKINQQNNLINIFINENEITMIDVSDIAIGQYEWILERNNNIQLKEMWEFKK